MAINTKDISAGAFFAAVGLLYGGITLAALPIGQAVEMGPGYFPIVLSGLLVVLGIAIALRGFFHGAASPFGVVPWRALFMLMLAIMVFATFLEELGLFPAVFLTAAIASMATRGGKLSRTVMVGAGISAFCTAIFGFGLDLQVPVFGSWFSF